MDARLAGLLDERDIRNVVYRYCRGVDRRNYELVRSCYHPDARDDHGLYSGGLEGFLEFLRDGLRQFEGTMHFIGNVLVEADGDTAACESYAVAYHRLGPGRRNRPARDYIVGLRYDDRFERRDGSWRIAERRCVFDWSRLDPVGSEVAFGPGFLRGDAGPAHPSYSFLAAGQAVQPPDSAWKIASE